MKTMFSDKMRTKIKICGLSRLADIVAVNEARPDYVGFVFAKSRRRVTADVAAELVAELSPGIIPVGVFVDAGISEIAELYAAGTIEIAQLHGSEDEEYISELRHAVDVPIIKAFRMDGSSSIAEAALSSADCVLLDNGAGGTGEVFNWDMLRGFMNGAEPAESTVLSAYADIKVSCTESAKAHINSGKSFFLAGGVNESNIREALSLRPYCIDVSSGAETYGIKDSAKINNLVNIVRQATLRPEFA